MCAIITTVMLFPYIRATKIIYDKILESEALPEGFDQVETLLQIIEEDTNHTVVYETPQTIRRIALHSQAAYYINISIYDSSVRSSNVIKTFVNALANLYTSAYEALTLDELDSYLRGIVFELGGCANQLMGMSFDAPDGFAMIEQIIGEYYRSLR